MQIEHTHPCAHKPCICEINSDQSFCSDHCRDQAKASSDICQCGHTDCALEPALADPALAQPA